MSKKLKKFKKQKIVGICLRCWEPLQFYGRSGKEIWCRCGNDSCSDYRKKIIFYRKRDGTFRRKKGE